MISIILPIVFIIASFLYYDANVLSGFGVAYITIPLIGQAVTGITYWIGSLVIAYLIYLGVENKR